jgi:hypothetical protein
LRTRSRISLVLPIAIVVFALAFGSISSAMADARSVMVYSDGVPHRSSHTAPMTSYWAVIAAVAVVVVTAVAVTITTLEGAPPIDPAPVTAGIHGQKRMSKAVAARISKAEFDH